LKKIIALILETYHSKKINLLAPIVKGRKGHYRELFEDIRKKGYNKVRIDGAIVDITPKMQVDRYKIHDIEIVVDRLEINTDIKTRLNQSLQTAMKHGKGTIMVLEHVDDDGKIKKKTSSFGFGKVQFYSRMLMCPTSGISYDEPAPNLF
jgi:excinuclease ABC subunit A